MAKAHLTIFTDTNWIRSFSLTHPQTSRMINTFHIVNLKLLLPSANNGLSIQRIAESICSCTNGELEILISLKTTYLILRLRLSNTVSSRRITCKEKEKKNSFDHLTWNVALLTVFFLNKLVKVRLYWLWPSAKRSLYELCTGCVGQVSHFLLLFSISFRI